MSVNRLKQTMTTRWVASIMYQYSNVHSISADTIDDFIENAQELKYIKRRSVDFDFTFAATTTLASNKLKCVAALIIVCHSRHDVPESQSEIEATLKDQFSAGVEVQIGRFIDEGMTSDHWSAHILLKTRLVSDESTVTAYGDFHKINVVVHNVRVPLSDHAKATNCAETVSSGIANLDAIVGGFKKRELTILAERCNMGAQDLALNIAQNVAVQTAGSVAYFSLASSLEVWAQKMLSINARVVRYKIKQNRVNKDEQQKIEQALSELAGLPIYIDASHGMPVEELCRRVRRLNQNLTKSLSLLIIDDIHQLYGCDQCHNRTKNIFAAYYALKQLAVELELPIVILSDVKRDVEHRANKRPVLCDLQGFPEAAELVGLIMFLYRDELYHPDNNQAQSNRYSEIIIVKNIDGPVGTACIHYDSRSGWFECAG